MSTRKPTPRAKAKAPRKRGPRPNNPYGIENERWMTISAELLKYEGKWIAWSPSHEEILASGDDLKVVDDEVQRLGYDPTQTPFEWVEPTPRWVATEE